MSGPHLRKYGVETTFNFSLYEIDGVDFKTDAADAGTDCNISKDEGAFGTCTNDFVDEGTSYSLTLDATEMSAARIMVHVIDSATKVYLDKEIVVETYGNASAQHAFDLDTAATTAAALVDNIWDEDIIAAHGTGDTAGLVLRALDLTQHTNNPTLIGKLGVADTAGADVPSTVTDEVLDEALSGHTSAGTLGKAVADIETDTTTDIPAQIAALVDDILDEVNTGATHNVNNSVGKQIRQGATIANTESAVDDPGAAATTTVFNTDLTEVDDFWNDSILIFTSGALAWQSRTINDYANTGGQIMVDEALTGIPGDGDTFTIQSTHVHPLSQIKAEVVDALSVDTYAEPGQETPAATAPLATKIGYIFKGQRNRSTQTASEYALYNDDAVTVDQKATFSDDTATADRGELETGP